MPNTWEQNSMFVIESLREIRATVDRIEGRSIRTQLELAEMRGRAGALGAIAGTIGGALVSFLVEYLVRH